MNIGDTGSLEGILCRVVDRQGGLAWVETPHGTRIKLGIVILSLKFKPMTEEEQKQYDEWVIDAKEKGSWTGE